MKRREGKYNDKRKIRPDIDEPMARKLKSIRYGGNPEHKRNPGDFGLTPPALPRRDKTLCDDAEVFQKGEALRLLRAGAKRGLVSVQMRNGFPQNIWAVTKAGIPLESELENLEAGIYHGYPMPLADPFRKVVLERWNTK